MTWERKVSIVRGLLILHVLVLLALYDELAGKVPFGTVSLYGQYR